MRRQVLTIAALAALALPAAAQASGWRNLDGQPVPDISAKEWFNVGKKAPSTADLRGKVYLIEFFATW